MERQYALPCAESSEPSALGSQTFAPHLPDRPEPSCSPESCDKKMIDPSVSAAMRRLSEARWKKPKPKSKGVVKTCQQWAGTGLLQGRTTDYKHVASVVATGGSTEEDADVVAAALNPTDGRLRVHHRLTEPAPPLVKLGKPPPPAWLPSTAAGGVRDWDAYTSTVARALQEAIGRSPHILRLHASQLEGVSWLRWRDVSADTSVVCTSHQRATTRRQDPESVQQSLQAQMDAADALLIHTDMDDVVVCGRPWVTLAQRQLLARRGYSDAQAAVELASKLHEGSPEYTYLREMMKKKNDPGKGSSHCGVTAATNPCPSLSLHACAKEPPHQTPHASTLTGGAVAGSRHRRSHS